MKNEELIERLLDSGLDFAIYRFPGESQPHLVLQREGHAASITPYSSLSDLNSTLKPDGFSGFIFAPFAETRETPTLLIRPDVAVRGWELIDIETDNLPHHRSVLSLVALRRQRGDVRESSEYKKAFSTFKYQLDRENYQKLVLSHSQLEQWSGAEDLAATFLKALDMFPHQMVYLVNTRQGGRWFGCTPELLLEGFDRKWHTMSLAGTMEAPLSASYGEKPREADVEKIWNQKNLHEQALVTDYIEGQLQGLGARIMREGPYTVRAGRLLHLRTDFTFHLQKVVPAYTLARLLHPTPAVCGLPKDEAWRFIRLHEHNHRMYYSGFLGPINLRTETNLYVNIRCANIRPHGKALFFAGGGLTRDSRYEDECDEVRHKLQTLKSINS